MRYWKVRRRFLNQRNHQFNKALLMEIPEAVCSLHHASFRASYCRKFKSFYENSVRWSFRCFAKLWSIKYVGWVNLRLMLQIEFRSIFFKAESFKFFLGEHQNNSRNKKCRISYLTFDWFIKQEKLELLFNFASHCNQQNFELNYHRIFKLINWSIIQKMMIKK